jgi:RHS repeat-associated protein
MRLRSIVLMIAAQLSPLAVNAQTATNPVDIGLQEYHNYQGGDIDHINLDNGNLSITIPLVSYPQRGSSLKMDLALIYNGTGMVYNEYCPPHLSQCWYQWSAPFTPYIQMALTPSETTGGPGLFDTQQVGSWSQDIPLPGTNPQQYFDQVSWYTFDGGTHPGGQISTGQISLDGSGFQSNFTETVGQIVTDTCTWDCSLPNLTPSPALLTTHNGITYFSSNSGQLERVDADGNYIAGTTDTVGRSIPAPTVYTSPTSSQKAPCSSPSTVIEVAIWTPPGYSEPFTFCYSYVTLNYTEIVGGVYQVTVQQLMLQSLALANGQTWAFQYAEGGAQNTTQIPNCPGVNTTNLGDLTQITFPTGGTISYTYECIRPPGNSSADMYSTVVTSRTVNANDGAGNHTWNYEYGNATTTVTDPNENDTVSTYSSSSRVTTQYSGTGSGRTVMRTTTLAYQSQYATDGAGFPMYPTTKTVTLENGLETQTAYTYCCDLSFYTVPSSGTFPSAASYGKVTDAKVYDYATSGLGTLLKETKTTYLFQSNSNYLNPGFFNLKSTVEVLSGNGVNGTGGGNYTSGTEMANTTYTYDQASLVGVNSGISGLSGAQMTSPIYGVYGHLTTQDDWLSTGGSDPVTTTSYYDTGEVYQVTDPMLNVTSTYYCTGSSPTTLPCTASTYLGALPTVIANALNQQSKFTYRTDTGQKTKDTDPNSESTTYTYNDSLNRLTKIAYPDGGSTTIQYNDSAAPFGVTVTEAITSSLSKQTQANVDGLGRLYETELLSDPSETTYTYTTYDALGRKYQVWNPTRCIPPNPQNCVLESTYGITTYEYDALNREILLIPPDGNPTTDNEPTTYTGNTTNVTDEAGHYRISTVDALGHLTQVSEGTAAYITQYTYDALNNLTCVEQHGGVSGTGCSSAPSNDATSQWHVRRFSYDSLSRLLTAKNPETGTVTYGYNTDSFMTSKKDARGIKITYTPDKLNRVTQKTYTDSTPTVTYSYDAYASGSNYGIGRRTGMTDGSGSTTWTYDTMGRVWTEQKTVGTVTLTPVINTYNLDGSVNSQTYPGGSVFNFTMGGDGRPISEINPTHSINYVQNAVYAPTGQLTSALYGESSTYTGITQNNSYNNRGQPIYLQACGQSSCAGSTYLQYLTYNYGLGTNDNGNVQSITNKKNTARNQTFSYDGHNRLTEAISGSWGMTFNLDAWGNLYSTGNVSGLTNPMSLNQAMSTGSQVNINQFQLLGYSYDAAGNVLTDGVNSGCGANAYTWDAEERITCSNGSTYTYDGDGNRVEKNGGSATPTLYFGDNIETDISGTETAVYVFFNGRRIAQRASNVVYVYLPDMLGSSTVVATAGTAPNYVVENESDFYPFGGEGIITQGLTSQHFKFNGKERDPESGLDNFGARYNNSITGRFESPDWADNAEPVPYAKLDNPQTLNLYAFVANNPESAPDLDGHQGEIMTTLDFGLDSSDITFDPTAQGGSPVTVQSWAIARGLDPFQTEASFQNSLLQAITAPLAQQQTGVAASCKGCSTQKKAALAAEKAALDPTRASVKSGHYHEYGGWILKGSDGGYTYTVPLAGSERTVNIDNISVPDGYTAVADYHSHPHVDAAEGEGASIGDIQHAIGYNRTGYVMDSVSGHVYQFGPTTPHDSFPIGTPIGYVTVPQ